ncbi:MAG: hypothetical protein H7Z17_05260 [Fuerstia sp.]|nr:hypothetical protein [Fuerstiella sp.]
MTDFERDVEHRDRSRVLVLCMSEHAFGSDWTMLKSQTFRFRDPLNRQRRFIPLRLDDTQPKGSLAECMNAGWRQRFTTTSRSCGSWRSD